MRRIRNIFNFYYYSSLCHVTPIQFIEQDIIDNLISLITALLFCRTKQNQHLHLNFPLYLLDFAGVFIFTGNPLYCPDYLPAKYSIISNLKSGIDLNAGRWPKPKLGPMLFCAGLFYLSLLLPLVGLLLFLAF